MDTFILLAAALVLIPALYTYTASMVQMRFPRLTNKRICLLIAHPDDEAMFFAPTLLSLTKPETGNHVKILCLSTGNADGLGETRKKELVKSAASLGVRPDDVWVEDRPQDFPDSMTRTWDPSKISTLLFEAFAPHLLARQSSKLQQQPTAAIDVIITFDSQGVSSHPNHISLYHGARGFLADLMRGRSGWANPVDLYVLSSVSIVRKYTWILDTLPTLAFWAARSDFKGKAKKNPEALVFMNQLVGGELAAAWGAMTSAHKSQMAWFRYGWITFSRYMVMNDLRREKVKAKS